MKWIWEPLGDYLLNKALETGRRQANLTEKSVTLSNSSMAYFQSNQPNIQAKAILFLHGIVADKSTWIPLVKYLHPTIPIIIPDLLGHGDTTASSNLTYTIETQAEAIHELMAKLGIGNIHLVGNSMGGAVAIAFAAQYPDLVKSLILIDSAGAEVTPSLLRKQYEQTGINPMLDINNVFEFQDMLQTGVEASPYIPRILLAAMTRNFMKRKPIYKKVFEDVEPSLHQEHRLSQLTMPTLIIWGKKDKVLHVDNAEYLHQQITNSRKVILSDLGHIPMVEAPEDIAALCEEFWAEQH